MRLLCLGIFTLSACDPASSAPTEEGAPDPFAASKADDSSSLEMAWDPPRTLGLAMPLADQELEFALTSLTPTGSTSEQTVDDNGNIDIDVVVHSEARLVFEVGRYFLDLDQDARALRIVATPVDEGFEARWWIGRPGQEGLTSYEGNVVTLDQAAAGRYRVAVFAGATPALQATFRYTIEARTR